MYEYRAKVAYIHDADTVRLDVDLGFGVWTRRQPFRLFGIDAPELGSEAGRAARDWLRDLLPVGTDLIVLTHKDKGDKFGRMLADLYLVTPDGSNLSINDQLIDAGHARPYDGGTR